MTGSFLTLGLLFAGRSVAAQDVGNAPHPAHIHSGSCTELGDVVYPLTDVSAGSTSMTGSPTSAMMGSPVAGMAEATPTTEMAMGTPAGTPAGPFGVVIETSDTTVEAAPTDLTAGGYAINVHESAENIGNYIACGDIMGTATANGDVTIALDTLNDSGYSGTATLHDNGDGTTTVSITLTHADL
jgi:hypothetical protein